MADEKVAPNAGSPASGVTTDAKIAGKFDTPEAFDKGFRELSGKLGWGSLPESVKLVGEGGIHKDQDAAIAAYKSMESDLGRRTPPKADPVKPTFTPEPALQLSRGPEEGDDPKTIITKSGLKPDELMKKWQENGKLDDADYAALHKAKPGFTRRDIDTFAKGMVAEAQLQQQIQQSIRVDAIKIVGSEDKLNNLILSAKSFVPDDEWDDIDERLKNPKSYKGALRDMLAFHAEQVGAGKVKPLVDGQNSSGGGVPQTSDEFRKLMHGVHRGDVASLQTLGKMTPEQISKLG